MQYYVPMYLITGTAYFKNVSQELICHWCNHYCISKSPCHQIQNLVIRSIVTVIFVCHFHSHVISFVHPESSAFFQTPLISATRLVISDKNRRVFPFCRLPKIISLGLSLGNSTMAFACCGRQQRIRLKTGTTKRYVSNQFFRHEMSFLHEYYTK